MKFGDSIFGDGKNGILYLYLNDILNNNGCPEIKRQKFSLFCLVKKLNKYIHAGMHSKALFIGNMNKSFSNYVSFKPKKYFNS